MRVLLVEDEPASENSVAIAMTSAGYDCDCMELGETGLEIGTLHDYDLIILDLALPDMDEYEALRRLLIALVQTPVLVLASMPRPDKRLRRIGVSAYNYLAKPFDNDVLLARMKTIALRGYRASTSVVNTGKLSVNLQTRAVEVARQPLSLTVKEYEILELLILRKGEVVSKETILNHLYGGKDEPNIKIIDVFVCKLRKKLSGASEGENFIDTIWGRGYVMRDSVVVAEKIEDQAEVQSAAA